MSSILLYDIDRKEPRSCWSPNVWKTRYVLNFKGLDYKTQWLEFPDIVPTLEAKNFENSTEPGVTYTCPAILFTPTPTSAPIPIMESLAIAKALEEHSPQPSLHLDAPELPRVLALILQLRKSLAPVAFPILINDLLNPRSAEWKEKSLVAFLGMSIDQFGKLRGGEAMWKRAGEPLTALADMLKEKEGPFLMGDAVSFADFVIAAFLQAGKKFGDGVMYNRMIAFDSVFEQLFKATEKWAGEKAQVSL